MSQPFDLALKCLDATHTVEIIRSTGACDDALAWLGDEEAAIEGETELGRPRSLAEIFEDLHRADWWLWLAKALGVDKKPLTLVASACARKALSTQAAPDQRFLDFLTRIEQWAGGDSSIDPQVVRDDACRIWEDLQVYGTERDAYWSALHAIRTAINGTSGWCAAEDAAAVVPNAELVVLVKQHIPLEMMAQAMMARYVIRYGSP